MTDPIQATNQQPQGNQTQGQQGGQQPHVDDILGEDDIFNSIPEANEEENLPYGDILEKKYQYEPIPEMQTSTAPEKVVAPVSEAPVPEVKISEAAKIETPVVEETAKKIEEEKSPIAASVVENVVKKEIQEINQQAGVEQEKVETLLDTKLQTDSQKKFGELFFTTKRIYSLKEKLGTKEDSFDILGADNDKIFVSYRFVLDESSDPTLMITKIEQDKTTEEETKNELKFMFNEEESSLEVVVNDILLFNETQDFTEDQKKKMQVSEKLNKFIFLATEEQKKLEKEIQIKEEEEKEKRKLQDIFRNF